MVVQLRSVGWADEVPQHIIVIGLAGEIPSATEQDVADFLFVVPYDLILVGLKLTAKEAPTSTTTIQIRRSTDNGVSYSNFFGTVNINSGSKVGNNDPSPVDINGGDILNFSITSGGGSGVNLALFIRAIRK